jgi:hypothetical protein
MKYKVSMAQNFPFAQNPGLCEIEGDKILCNDVMLPASIDGSCRYNPHNVRPWVIGHVFGALCMVFASCEQYALDSAVDAGLMGPFMSEDQDHDDENLTPLGNASELFDLSDCWIGEVSFEPARDILLIVALARAAESGADTLE